MKHVLTVLALLMAIRVSAQLMVGNAGLTIQSGTTLTVDGLALTPTSSLTIANNSIQRTTTPVAGNPSINRLYQFGSPLLFSGKVQLNYLTSELNGYNEPRLQIAYAPASNAALTVTTSSTVNTASDFVTNSLTNQPLFIVTATALSDLTPLLYARPSTATSSTTVTVVVDVVELNDVATRGNFQVRISRDPLIKLSFDQSLTVLDSRPIQNQAWQFDNSDEDYYILTTTQSIGASDQLSFGLSGILNPGSTTGVLTVSTSVVDRGLIERRLTNNVDADKIDYFQR